MHFGVVHILFSLFSLLATALDTNSKTCDSNMLKIAVLGGGSVGTTLAKALTTNGKYNVVIAARDPDKTQTQLAEKKLELAVEPVTQALESAKIIILATPGFHDDEGIVEFAKSLGDTTDKIILDATNPLGPFQEGLNVRWNKELSGGEVLAKALPTAKVYKTFNTVGVEHMASALGKDMMIAGDPEESSRQIAEDVVSAVGFKPFYVGPIRYARNLEAIAELWIHMAVPPLGGRTTTRKFWFSISGDP